PAPKSRRPPFSPIRRKLQPPRPRPFLVRPNRHAHRYPPLRILLPRAPKMLRTMLLRLPVHPCGPLVINLHAVHSHVAPPRLGILGKHQRKRDKPPAILRPAFQDWEVEKVHVLPFPQDLLTASRFRTLREE